jgi:hypothetical protein
VVALVQESLTGYKANLQRVGSATNEMITLLHTYHETGNWDSVREKALQENLLRKGSSHTIIFILREAKRRFFNSNLGLPKPEEVASFLEKDIPKNAKTQLIFIFLCESDPLVKQVILSLVSPRVLLSNPKITREDVVAFLEQEAISRPELGAWTETLKQRWASGFLATLRDFGLMEAPPNQKLMIPSVRIEIFVFFTQWMIDSGLSGLRIINHPLWRLLLLSLPKTEQLLIESQRRGWISYSRAGDILEIRSHFSSLRDWLNHGLG